MNDSELQDYIAQLMLEELAPSIPYPVSLTEARAYGATVLDRFRNPHIRHPWLSITLNYSSKLKLRVVPVLLRHYEQQQQVPQCIALGFAAYLCFTQPLEEQAGKYLGRYGADTYPIQDEQAGRLRQYWQLGNTNATVNGVLSDTQLWGTDLSILPGFADTVVGYVNKVQQAGMRMVLKEVVQEMSAKGGQPAVV